MSKALRKLNRYYKLISNFRNWPQFLFFKMSAKGNEAFEFQLKNSFKINVPRNMLGPFRECFLDEIYLRHIDKSLLNKKELTVIDIGANVGYFSLYMFYKYPQSKIYAFEPIPYCFNVLKNYQTRYNQFHWNIYQNAVSDKNIPIEIYTDAPDGFSTTSSMFSTDKAHKIQVEAKKLDDLIREKAIDRIDLMKLDCEGAEYSILYNLSDDIWKKTSSLSIEAHDFQGKGENLYSLIDFLKTKNYKIEFEAKKGGGHIWASVKA